MYNLTRLSDSIVYFKISIYIPNYGTQEATKDEGDTGENEELHTEGS